MGRKTEELCCCVMAILAIFIIFICCFISWKLNSNLDNIKNEIRDNVVKKEVKDSMPSFHRRNEHYNYIRFFSGISSLLYQPGDDYFLMTIWNENIYDLHCLNEDHPSNLDKLILFKIIVYCTKDEWQSWFIANEYQHEPMIIHLGEAKSDIIIRPRKNVSFSGNQCSIALLGSDPYYIPQTNQCYINYMATIHQTKSINLCKYY